MKRHIYYQIKNELNNYYNHSCAPINFKCSYSSFISQMWGKNPTTYSDPILNIDKIAKNRTTYQKLSKLPLQEQRLLDATYNIDYPWNDTKSKDQGMSLKQHPFYFQSFSPVLIVFGELTGAVIMTNMISIPDLIKLCNKKLKKCLSDDEQKLMFLVRDKADKLYEAAHQAFLKAKV